MLYIFVILIVKDTRHSDVRDAEKTKDYRKWARVGHLNRLLQISKFT